MGNGGTDNGADFRAGLYGSWEGRIEHLEKIRYLLLGAEMAILTYVLNAVMLKEPSGLGPNGLLMLHTVAAIFAMVIARLIENVSRGANLAAIELMLLEYRMGVVGQGLGYYARRAGRRRHGFKLLPVAGDLLSILFIGASWVYQLQEARYPPSSAHLFMLLFVVALALGMRNHLRAEAMFEHKDSLDLWCQKNETPLAAGEAGEELSRRKRPTPEAGPFNALLNRLRGR